MHLRLHIAILFLTCSAQLATALTTEQRNIPVLFLEQSQIDTPVLSNIRKTPQTSGLDGAHVGISDNNTTGRFTGDHYHLSASLVKDSNEAIAAAQAWVESGNTLIVAKLPAATLLKVSRDEHISQKAIIFNISAKDDALRSSQCRPRLLHTIPSRAMLTDGLAQFLISKRWKKWLLLRGQHDEDTLFSAAIKRSAHKFGANIIDEREWQFNADLRRSAQSEIRLFSQSKDYDVTLIADEIGDIGEYIPYNTWLARPAAGTQGLTPTGWHWSIEQWGAAQLQNRFSEYAKRDMNDIDYAGWLAVRAIGEAVTRTKALGGDTVYQYLMSDDFQLSAFKGRSLSFRKWNGQLRQPIPLVQPNALISQSPQEGYLHPHSEMDTLGYDRPEVSCAFEASTL
ncbi:ABC transporter substrate-binding protein [uncultured Zhongshania sp.]|uniref:ABC transporter substrate-binding protein n=1 Tax=uncultured Zhongshania sp. TaxID=1642288 RepID=UPI0025D49804|nr:ABC transporter substrate-binding protein [uncultured Zhongshania sp.]